MTPHQLHGNRFADQIKGCGLFDRSSDASRRVDAEFDIEARFDRRHALPTSVKTTGSKIVTLSDARRFWRLNQPFRMLVGPYAQAINRKVFSRVEEFVIHGPIFADLKGELSIDDVTHLHDGIGLARFPRGQQAEARAWIADQLAAVANRRGKVILNPKIDSRGQRRLQCSVRLDDLIELAGRHPQYNNISNHQSHQECYGDLGLPLTLMSTRREFRPRRLT